MDATKLSYLPNSKVALLRSVQNKTGICPLFYGRNLPFISIQTFLDVEVKIILLSMTNLLDLGIIKPSLVKEYLSIQSQTKIM